MAEFDIIIYGATGFTGRLVAEYINANYSNRPWAMAGRNLDKLIAVRDEMGLPSDTALVTADASDPISIEAMAKRTKVIITTVGPYQLYGEPLVAACAKVGTDYVDLSGEPSFMWDMIDKYNDVAKASGARIVHSCGFDSVPSDMGVYFLQAEASKRFGTPLKDVRCRVRSLNGTFSGGTAASGRATMKAAMSNPKTMQKLLSPFALTPGFQGVEQPYGNKPYEDIDLGSWVAPFFMAPVNTKNVHRSNMLMGHPYGTDFTYEEMIFTGPGPKGEAMAKHIADTDPIAGQSDLKPGDGPSKEERENGSYDMMFTGVSENGERLIVGVKGDRDPGYGSTCKVLTECAVCLLEDVANADGGILTPAPVFGDAIIKRVSSNAGLIFEVEN
ncbi:saccharopine dehydrogenase [Amylibacter sp. SFDW26]|uniref:saccharopine dehydrogenase family protein n=1 Tax=Amylibacter sp. SFDW26 TaxID=2652722 RepID=UPI001261BD84|nr:saccharopine dehydrogenase NADP-binding domain-containing protein [Amylibacter sp. SFDW26]KAB7613376.1 saccharopine dehydrogenase [Amylibacter sp. SFDW26]